MKRFFRIFELSKSEQRIILIVMLILITIAFVGYERRIHRVNVHNPTVTDAKTSPTHAQTKGEQ
jgi:hypothetical protein